MAEVEVKWQRYFSAPENISWGVHRVRLISTADHLKVQKNLESTNVANETLGDPNLPTFYQYATANGDRVQIEGTVGDKHWVITKHRSVTNQGDL